LSWFVFSFASLFVFLLFSSLLLGWCIVSLGM
jgi:hypothetical protein